jgi:hypothetical protein
LPAAARLFAGSSLIETAQSIDIELRGDVETVAVDDGI